MMSQSELTELRQQLEAIDAECVTLLGRRLEVARRVGAHKRTHGLAPLDPRREARVVNTAAQRAREAGLPEEAIRGIFWQVVAMSRSAQQGETP